MRSFVHVVAAASCTAVGCASVAPGVGGAKHCAPPSAPALSIASDPPPPLAAPHDEHVAALLGLHQVFVDRRAPGGAEASPDAAMRVLARIEFARLVVAATVAEVRCEAERAEQVGAYLAAREASASKAFTVASVLVGAATGVAGAFLSASNAKPSTQEIVAVSGGAIGVGLGLGALFVHPSVELLHPRNQLADIWAAPRQASSFPPLVWAYLSRPEFTSEKAHSLRERIVDRWRQFGALDGGAEVEALLFGGGGAYDVAELRTRAAMLEGVEAEVDLMNQDIADLAAAIEPR